MLQQKCKSIKSKHFIKTYILLLKNSHLNLSILRIFKYFKYFDTFSSAERKAGFDNYSVVFRDLPMYGTKTAMLVHTLMLL